VGCTRGFPLENGSNQTFHCVDGEETGLCIGDGTLELMYPTGMILPKIEKPPVVKILSKWFGGFMEIHQDFMGFPWILWIVPLFHGF